MRQSDATRRYDRKMRAYLASLEPERRKAWLESRKGTRDGTKPDTLFDSIVGGFEWMDYVACTTCGEWMSRHASGRGEWAVDHRHCSAFRFFEELDDIPEDYTTPLSDTELLAGVLSEWEKEEAQ